MLILNYNNYTEIGRIHDLLSIMRFVAGATGGEARVLKRAQRGDSKLTLALGGARTEPLKRAPLGAFTVKDGVFMKSILLIFGLIVVVPFATLKAETVYLRASMPVSLKQCKSGLAASELHGFVAGTALKYGLHQELYFYPRSRGCDLTSNQSVVVAHGFFSGDKEKIQELVAQLPPVAQGTLEAFFVKEFEARYYIYTNSTTLNLEDVFVRRFNSMEAERRTFVLAICDGTREHFLEALKSSPKFSEAQEAITLGSDFLNLGYNSLDLILENGSRLSVLPFLQDRWGEEWRCY